MTTAAISIILTLCGILILILGVGGGKMFSEKKFDGKLAALDNKYIVRCDDLHIPCLEARMAAEKNLKEAIESLENVLLKQLQPRLIMGNFIMDALAEKIGVPKATLEQIKQNVRNGSLSDI